MNINPFTPNFGEIPRHMAGRDQIINATLNALDRESRSRELNMLLYGARGTGKTAMLGLIAEEAPAHGWISASVNCYKGMLEDIYEQTLSNGREFLSSGTNHHISGLGIGNVFTVERERDNVPPGNWRTRITQLLEELEKNDIGLLITVDEVDPAVDEMILLSSVYQLLVRERRHVGLLMAGLPSKVSSLIQNKSVSFLRRSKMQPLGRISDVDVSLAMERTIGDGGAEIASDALEMAVHAADGFAFMLQLVGYYMWESLQGKETIGVEEAKKGIRMARAEMEQSVLEPTYRNLSDGDIDFCLAMLEDERESRFGDIVERLGKNKSTVGTYRRRLIEQGVIGSPRRGILAFELPLFREYLARIHS